MEAAGDASAGKELKSPSRVLALLALIPPLNVLLWPLSILGMCEEGRSRPEGSREARIARQSGVFVFWCGLKLISIYFHCRMPFVVLCIEADRRGAHDNIVITHPEKSPNANNIAV
jgi:hypothetical protein